MFKINIKTNKKKKQISHFRRTKSFKQKTNRKVGKWNIPLWEILQVNVESNVSSKRTRFPQNEKAMHEYFFKQETNCNILLHIYFNKNKCPTLLQPFFLQTYIFNTFSTSSFNAYY